MPTARTAEELQFKCLALKLGEKICSSPRAFEGDGVLAVCWPLPSDDGPRTAYYALVDGRDAHGMVAGTPFEDVGPATVRADVPFGDIMHLFTCGLFERWNSGIVIAPEAREAIRRIAGAVDAKAILAATGLPDRSPKTLAFLSSSLPHADTVRAFARAHVWLVAPAAASHAEAARSAAATGDPDAVAAAVIRKVAPEVTAAQAYRLAMTMRGQHPIQWTSDAALGLLATVPPEATAQLGPEVETLNAVRAMHEACARAADLAAVTGRAPRSVLGRVPPDPDYLSRLSARGLGAPTPYAATDVLHDLLDLVRAFDRDVVRPARAALGREQPPDGAIDTDHAPLRHPPFATAIRVLVGDRTLPAVVELSGRWHARTDGIARAFAIATDGRVGEGHRLCPDLDLGEGLFLTCLTKVAELVDEGAPGPDAHGADGLGHCVGSYARDVVTGGAFVLSLRRRLPGGGYERVATVEASPRPRLAVVQARGRGNAEVDPDLVSRVERALQGVGRDGASAPLAASHTPCQWPTPEEMASEPGMWERMRDAWAFALPRPLRAAGPAELLAYGGEHG